MSTEARLTRLGLLHLEDKPEELQRELQKRISEGQAKLEASEAKRKASLAAKAANSATPETSSSQTNKD